MEAIGEDGVYDPSEQRGKADVITGFSRFFEGDVVVAKITPCFENGKGAFIHRLEGGVGFGTTELHVLSPLDGVDGKFLYWICVREFTKDKIESTAADLGTMKVALQGDIVFNKMRMWQGAVGVSPCDGLTGPDYVVATPIGGCLHTGYARELFRTAMFSAECARHSNGLVWDRLRLYWEGFRDIWVPPPLSKNSAPSSPTSPPRPQSWTPCAPAPSEPSRCSKNAAPP